MVIGNHRGKTVDFGPFDSQSDAITAVEVARSAEREPENPLNWKIVSDPENSFGFYHYISAWDGTCTIQFNIVELNDPRESLDEMIQKAFGFVGNSDETISIWDDVPLKCDSYECNC